MIIAGFVAEDTLEGTKNLINEWLSLSEEQKKSVQKNTVICFEKKFNIAQASKNLVALLRDNQND